ncbi:heme NO-binding domain-containing protein [Blastopirellula retiformator]|uniref:heme NO-binding domain-containing protein n=1 Tax=Blastopirellula retiformator TaxID=2527970 RepID=UPI00164524AA|nr:heme NO-binding domain-containing protein [Blastopirellula retiformator]
MFCEFLDWVEDRYGLTMVDRIILRSELATGGAYTSIGDYDHDELRQLVAQLSSATQTTESELLHCLGARLFARSFEFFPRYFGSDHSAFDVLSNVDERIRVEIRTLYPDADVLKFEWGHEASQQWSFAYRSSLACADLVEGMLTASVERFRDQIELEREELEIEHEPAVCFRLTTRDPILTHPALTH